jgi:hypothetical protein
MAIPTSGVATFYTTYEHLAFNTCLAIEAASRRQARVVGPWSRVRVEPQACS